MVEIDAGRIVQTAWRHRNLLWRSVGAWLLLAIIYLHVAAYQYTVTLQVVPVTSGSQPSGGTLSSLGALAGVDVGKLVGGDSAFRYYADGIKSRAVADILAKDQALLRLVFPKEWSAETNSWRQPFSITRPIKNIVFGILGLPVQPWSPPSGLTLNDYLKENLVVLTDSKSPVVALQLESDRPAAALQLLSRLNQVTDDMLRARALRRADQYIDYIGEQLNRVTVAEYRMALLQNLYEQEKTRMMASAHISYAADVFSGPTISSRPTSPMSPVILVLAMVLGVISGVFLALYAERYDIRFRSFGEMLRIRRANPAR